MDLTDIVVAEIDAAGPLPFGRFVDLALYHPTLGFYADGGAGRRRDFITSAEVGPLFGAVVARALDSVWDGLDRPGDFSVVEVGAGSGRLARAVLAATPRCASALHYVTVEVSDTQRAGHPDGVEARADLPEPGGVGVVFANELCDNLAFDLYDYDGVRWSEIRVGHVRGSLAEVAAEPSPLPAWLEALDTATLDASCRSSGASLRVPDQHGARSWLARALLQHERGRVVVIDYAVDGYPVSDERAWLRTYRGQDHGTHPLDRPGTQDITVDVAIDQLASVRIPDRVTLQADWLRQQGIDELVDDGRRIWREGGRARRRSADRSESGR